MFARFYRLLVSGNCCITNSDFAQIIWLTCQIKTLLQYLLIARVVVPVNALFMPHIYFLKSQRNNAYFSRYHSGFSWFFMAFELPYSYELPYSFYSSYSHTIPIFTRHDSICIFVALAQLTFTYSRSAMKTPEQL